MPRISIAFFAAVVAAFALLGGFDRTAPVAVLVPARVVAPGNQVIVGEQIRAGMAVWRGLAGRHAGTVLGHGAALGPDWTAEWLHHEANGMLERWAWDENGLAYRDLDAGVQAAVRERLIKELRTNTYDPATGRLDITDNRLRAIADNRDFYTELFGRDPKANRQRQASGMHPGIVPDDVGRRNLAAFLFWTAWASVTQRTGDDPSNAHATSSGGWPPDVLLGHVAPPQRIDWLVFAAVVLIAGVASLAHGFQSSARSASGRLRAHHASTLSPAHASVAAPALCATRSGVALLRLGALLLAARAALHVIPSSDAAAGGGAIVAQWLPYAVREGWLAQLASLWIAAVVLGAALCIGARTDEDSAATVRSAGMGSATAPWLVFALMLAVVVGSLASHWLAVMHSIDEPTARWLARDGTGVLALGRIWEALLLAAAASGALMIARAVLPPPRTGAVLVAIAAAALAGALYASGPTWADPASAATVEYWRAWVARLGAEGLLQLLAVALVAAASAGDRLVPASTAWSVVRFSALAYVAGAAIALWCVRWSGAAEPISALGAALHALQAIALLLIAWQAWRAGRRERGVWAWRFWLAASWWNLVRVTLLVVPAASPSALYYMHGLVIEPVHAQVGLLGVYAMLAIGTMLWVLERAGAHRTRGALAGTAFWALNLGVATGLCASVLPLAAVQLRASLEQGLWHARSIDFLAGEPVATIQRLRILGDLPVVAGALALAALTLVRTPRSRRELGEAAGGIAEALARPRPPGRGLPRG